MSANILGDRLRKLREQQNLTQKRAATIFGLTNFQLSRYEKGQSNPDPDLIAKFADYFDVSTDYLLGRTDDHNFTSREENTFDSLSEINRLLEKYEIDDMSFFDIEKWKSMSPEQIKELESYFQYLVQKSYELEKDKKNN
nr:helix-turn-helix transcriptional regulator [Halobacillus sp. A5]